jgi:outer membrane protein assembly factor BamB
MADVEAAQFTAGIGMTDVVPEDEVVLFDDERSLKRWGFDMKTGQKLWESDPEPQFHYYGFSQTIYDHKLISYSRCGGTLLAYDLRTGDIVWKYIATGEGTESPYGNAVTSSVMVADGKLYVGSSEHSASTPLWRTPGLRCVNATDGTEIWKILNWGTEMAVADGILVAFNWYDGQVYAYGKGPSATTVTASPKASVLGTQVVVEGTVTDQTPTGRRNINNEMQFTLKDTPAISDQDMQAWMEYKFKGQGRPTDAKGVEVVISVLDPNNNFYEVGRTTSDMDGNYGMTFAPEVSGNYKIFVDFAGSKAYYPSTSTTTLTVADAPQPTATTADTANTQSIADMYFIPAVIGIILAIAIVGAMIMIMMRKKP